MKGLLALWVFILVWVGGCDSPQVSVQKMIGDPLYEDQWHLKNTGQFGGLPGEDIDIEPLWNHCPGGLCRGEGTTIAVVDIGLEIAHEDLKDNIIPGSYNYATGGDDPTPSRMAESQATLSKNALIDQAHGTAVAGIVAARDQNGLGVRGVASRAGLIGINLLENDDAFNEADSMLRNISNTTVSLNSWGVTDGYGQLDAASSTWETAIDTGLEKGRKGLGTLYVWAAGNGALGSDDCPTCEDNSNYDGQANYRGVIAVGAVNHRGKRSSYSERGANLWVSAPGGEYCKGPDPAITTTDLMGTMGFNPNLAPGFDYRNQNYTKCMNGTSAAVPMVGGVISLMTQANPSLGWRDVRVILARSARQNDSNDPGRPAFPGDQRDQPGWVVNGGGYHVNHQYGFGVVDAWAAVKLAKGWKNLPPMVVSSEFSSNPKASIPKDSQEGISDLIQVSGTGISKIEWIEISFTSDHPYSGDLDITLTNTATGTLSRLAETHECFDHRTHTFGCNLYSGWVFGTARHLGEAADGSWKLNVRDLKGEKQGVLQSWSLKFYGS